MQGFTQAKGTGNGNEHIPRNYFGILRITSYNVCYTKLLRPGGKVVVYTGILPYTKDENGLAVVMGHEIAHAVARHGNERMSHAMLVQMGGVALSTAIQEKPEETQNLYNMAYGATTQVGVMLPFSRKHEYEADKMGLIFMAIAGYDPRSAVAFWQRMSANSYNFV